MSKSKKHSKLVFIVDRSGSMSSIASDMEGAMKEIVENQKKNRKDKDIYVTYVRFDNKYEKVFSDVPIEDAEDMLIEPRSTTALLDAMGKTINSVERSWSEDLEKDRADKVLFIIITDGLENDSREFSKDQVFEIIEKVKRDHGWAFTFIGANQDAIAEGGAYGVDARSSINYVASTEGIKGMARAVTNYTSSYLDGATGDALSYTYDDRSIAMGEDDS